MRVSSFHHAAWENETLRQPGKGRVYRFSFCRVKEKFPLQLNDVRVSHEKEMKYFGEIL